MRAQLGFDGSEVLNEVLAAGRWVGFVGALSSDLNTITSKARADVKLMVGSL